jgi:hypothetical protein
VDFIFSTGRFAFPAVILIFIGLSLVMVFHKLPGSDFIRAGQAFNYVAYKSWMLGVPLHIQSLIGLGFILGIGSVSLGMLVEQIPRFWIYRGFAGFLVWTLVYPFLHFHLSSPDFDDFFVIDKFLGSIGSDWANDKPFFTLYDYLYRVADLFFDTGTYPFIRFAVNGWLYILFMINLTLFLKRYLSKQAEDRLGSRAVIALGLALGFIGPIVLSHSLHYELAGAVVFLLSVNVLESLRARERFEARHTGFVLAWCAMGLLIQTYSHNQLNLMWVAVFMHAAFVLAEKRTLHKVAPVWALLLAASICLFILQHRNSFSYLTRSDSELYFIFAISVIPVSAILIGVWLVRMKTLSRWWMTRNPESTLLLIMILYFFWTFLLFLTPNKSNPGIPFPLFNFHWNWGTNHARYSILFYPFACLLIGHIVFKLRLSSARTLFIFALCALLWNYSYLCGFYFSMTPGDGEDTGSAFQRNMRPYEALRQMPTPANVPVYYLPIHRDHGDHYLQAAVYPDRPVTSICQSENIPPLAQVILSRHTLAVLKEEKRLNQLLPDRTSHLHRSLVDKDWEVQFVSTSAFDSESLNLYCHTYSFPGFSQEQDPSFIRQHESIK